MAGDWIKMRVDLADDPAVITIGSVTGLDEFAVVGRLHRLWSWADRHTIDGNAVSVTPVWVDRYVSCEKFSDGMVRAGWLAHDGDHVVFPHFERHNGETAKKRALTNKRVAEHREMQRIGNANGNAESNAPSVTESVTREEKRREEQDTNPSAPSGAVGPTISVLFDRFWSAYPKKRSKGDAEKAFKSVKPSEQLVDAMIAAIGRAKTSADWRKDGGQFIPHPATWLRDRRWLDEQDPAGVAATTSSQMRLARGFVA